MREGGWGEYMDKKWYEEGRDRCTPGTGRGETVEEQDGWVRWEGSKGEYERGRWLKEGKCEARETGGMRGAE